MPNDVGVLQLSIEDNSKQAAGGLQELERALSSIKTALSGGLNLPTQSVKNFAAAVSSNSKALSSTGTFLNAVKEYQKVFKDAGKIKFDSSPITELKTALQDGIKIGQAGTQLSKLRDAFTGDWGQVGDAGDEIHSAVSGMKAIKDMGDAFREGNTAQSIKEVADAINALSKAQNDMPSGGAHDLYGMFGGAQATEAGQNVGRGIAQGTNDEREAIINIIRDIAQAMIDAAKEKLDEHSPSKVFEDIGRNAMLGLKNGLFATRGEVQAASAEVAEQLSKQFYTQIKPTDMMGSPLEYLTDIFRQTNTSLNDYASGINAVLPKVQAMSSEEMVAAGNAKRFTAEISNLINQLNSFGAPKGQALQGIIDVITGVSRGNAGGGMINASSTMFTPVKEMTESFSAIREATEGTIQIFDSASGAYHEMYVNCANIAESAEKATESVQQMNQSITEGIALADMPASGKNGVFANANEEFLYLTGQIEKARAETQQFFDIAMKAENQLKYGGPRSKEDLQFDYQHGIEGYERAIAAEEKYQESLRELMTYVQHTASEMRSAVTDTHEAPIEQAAAQVSEAMDRIGSSRGIVAAREEMQSFGIASGEATSKIELLRNRVEELKRSYSEISRMPAALFGGSDGKASALNNVALKIGRVNEQIEKLVQNAHKAQAATSIKQLQESITVPQHDNMQFVENMVNQYSEIDLLTIKMQGMKQALADDITQNRVDTQQIAQRTIAIQQLRDKIEELKKAQNETTRETKNSISGWKAFGKGIKAMFPTLTGLIKRFKSMIVMRSIRYLVRQLAAGMSEGLQNVYQYSKAIGGSFAPAMDEAATALQQMKNSIGAALAPAIQALIPVLQTVVNWFINLVNYVNQFFALLNGQKTWTRALPATASAFDKQTKAAKGAGAAMKDLLADWDELNIIQSQTGGGSGAGSGTKAEDYLKMFEEVNTFDNKVRDVVKFVKDNFDTILASAVGIKAAMMAWRFSNAVIEWLPVLSKIATGFAAGATIGLSVMLSDLTGQMYTKTGSPAWLIADALSGAVGATLAGKLAAKIAGETAGTVVSAFTLILNGIVNIKNAIGAAAEKQRGKSFMLNALGAIEAGIGAGLLAATAGACTAASIATGVVTGLIALTIGIALSIKAEKDAEYKQMAIDAFAAQGKGGIDPDEYLRELQAEMDRRTADSKLVVNTSITLGENTQTLNDTLESIKVLNETIKGNEKLSQKDADAFKAAWDTVLETMKEISEINYSTMYAGLDEAIKNGSEKIKEAAIEYKAQALKMETIMNGAHAAFAKEIRMLEDQIITGTIDEEGLERYKELYEMLAEETETGLDKFRVALSEGMRFDFGSEDPVGKAVEFIKSMGSDTIQPALEAAEAQYNAEMEALEQSRKDLEKYHDKGFIKDDQYNNMKAFYDSMESFYFTRWEEQKKEINNSVNDALAALVEQSVAGYLELDSSDERALKSYVDNVFVPLEKAMEEAGLAVPDKLKQYIARNGQEVWKADVIEQYAAGSKEALYETFYDEMMAGNIDDALKFSVAYELDLINKDPNYLTDETRKEIVNALEAAFADPTRIIQELKETLGWSYEDILSAFDFSKLNESEISEITSLFEGLREAEIEALQYRTKIDPAKSDYLSWGEYTEEVEKVTKSYDELIKKIREYNGENINNSGKLEGITPEIKTANLVPARLSASAGFNYSDSGYGNRSENEPILTEPKDPQAETANVAAGVQKGNVDVVNAIQTIIPILTQILQKESTVVVAPGSDWGRHNAKSNSAWTKMTGAIPLEE